MNYMFCIVSAIGVDYGVYSYEERFKQLVATIDSIANHFKLTYIVIMEVSDVELPEEDLALLRKKTNKVCILKDHIFIKDLMAKLDNTDTNLTARKTIGELVGMLEFLGWLKQQPVKFDRVFKVSGRHRLNDNFLNIDYSATQDKVVCAKRYWNDRYAYLMQLWSFDPSKINELFDIFVKIWQHEIELLQTEGKVDILETTLYQYLNDNNIPIYEVPEYIGIEGNHGQDGVEVYA